MFQNGIESRWSYNTAVLILQDEGLILLQYLRNFLLYKYCKTQSTQFLCTKDQITLEAAILSLSLIRYCIRSQNVQDILCFGLWEARQNKASSLICLPILSVTGKTELIFFFQPTFFFLSTEEVPNFFNGSVLAAVLQRHGIFWFCLLHTDILTTTKHLVSEMLLVEVRLLNNI